jgi:hypothetical protein
MTLLHRNRKKVRLNHASFFVIMQKILVHFIANQKVM